MQQEVAFGQPALTANGLLGVAQKMAKGMKRDLGESDRIVGVRCVTFFGQCIN